MLGPTLAMACLAFAVGLSPLVPTPRVRASSRRAVLSGAAAAAAASLAPVGRASAAEPLIGSAKGFYNAWNDKDVDRAMSYFADSIVFYDGQYQSPFTGAAAVRGYLQDCADSLPGWRFVIDDYSEDPSRGRLGLRWHVEDSGNLPLPFPNRGLSFLEFDAAGKIVVCRDMIEATVKTGAVQLPLLRAVSAVLGIK